MRIYFSLPLLALVLFSCGLEQDRSSSAMGEMAVIGGQEVYSVDPLSKSLAAVLLEQSAGRYSICSASFVTSQVLLTAAHCLADVDSPEKIKIKFAREAKNVEGALEVESYLLHPEFARNQVSGDIALIKIKSPQAKAKLVSIVASDISDPDASELTALGYGRSTAQAVRGDDGSGSLRWVQLKLLSYNSNRPYFLVDLDPGRGVCFGDSGGPVLIHSYKSGVAAIYGILSRVYHIDSVARGCDSAAHYVNLRYYRPWLLENINRLDPAANLPY